MRLYETEALPSGIFACEAGGESVHILRCSPESLTLLTDLPLSERESLRVHFYQPSGNYRSIEVEGRLNSSSGERFRELDYAIENDEYRTELLGLYKRFANYISRRSDDTGSEYFGENDNITAVMEDNSDICANINEQYRWFGERLERIGNLSIWLALNTPELYRLYLDSAPNELGRRYEGHFNLPAGTIGEIEGIYVGSRICERLLPDSLTLRAVIEKAQREKIGMTLVLPTMRNCTIQQIRSLLSIWSGEVEINDWGELAMLNNQHKSTLGLLLNKRRIDPRLKYKDGYPDFLPLLSENAANDTLFREFLREQGIGRIEQAATGYHISLPEGKNSLHIGLLPINLSLCSGDENKSCGMECQRSAMLYPQTYDMLGRKCAIFAFEDGNSSNIEPQEYDGFDRIVLEL